MIQVLVETEGAFGEEDKAQWDYQSWYKAHSQSSEGIEKREIRSGENFSTLWRWEKGQKRWPEEPTSWGSEKENSLKWAEFQKS